MIRIRSRAKTHLDLNEDEIHGLAQTNEHNIRSHVLKSLILRCRKWEEKLDKARQLVSEDLDVIFLESVIGSRVETIILILKRQDRGPVAKLLQKSTGEWYFLLYKGQDLEYTEYAIDRMRIANAKEYGPFSSRDYALQCASDALTGEEGVDYDWEVE